MIPRPSLQTAAILAALTLLCCSSGDETPTRQVDASRDHVRQFWTTLRQANQARLDGRTEDAISAYRKSLLLDPNHEEALFYLGVSLEQAGRYTDAVSTYERLITRNPSSGRALSQLAELLLTPLPGAPPDFGRAESLIRRLLEANQEQAGPFLLLGRLELNRGDWPAAMKNFLLAAHSGAQEGYAWAGYTAYVQGDHDAAVEYCRQPLELQRRERAMAGSGVRAEGDVLPAPEEPLGALDRAALIATSLIRAIQDDSASRPEGFESIAAEIACDGKGSWGDYDGDGYPDLAVGGRRLILYHRTAGSFRDVTRQARLDGVKDVSELVWVDYDSDGRLDLYLSGGNGVQLFRNAGGGHFQDVAAGAKLTGKRHVSRALFFDIDGDGARDLLEAGSPGHGATPVRLYRNNAGVFAPASAPPVNADETAVDAAAADFDGDGRVDLALACWKHAVRVFFQRDNFTWEQTTPAAADRDTFSIVSLDYDRDGAMDLFVGNHASWEDSLRSQHQPTFPAEKSTPILLRNTGKGDFEDVTRAAGLVSAYGTMEALAADFDDDGWVDLLLANGSLDSCRLEPSVVLRNEHGTGFVSWRRIPAGDRPSNTVSGAVADFDGDGNLDIFLNSNPRLPVSVAAGGVFRNTLTREPASGGALDP